MTQFVKAKNVMKAADDCIHNIWLKVNEKLGGTNWKIAVPLPNAQNPIMVVGCSFSHSEVGSTEPTIVGFAASTQQGKFFVQWVTLTRPNFWANFAYFFCLQNFGEK